MVRISLFLTILSPWTVYHSFERVSNAFCVYRKFNGAKRNRNEMLCELIYSTRQQEAAARKLGINSSFIKGDYCYVLVRVSRFRETARLIKPIPPNQMLHDDVSAKIQDMQPGNSTETIQFMTTFGTHYINSYVTGNSLYQVRLNFFFFDFRFVLRFAYFFFNEVNSMRFFFKKLFLMRKEKWSNAQSRNKTFWNCDFSDFISGVCIFQTKLPTH